jgi:hypothetical protein
VLPSVIYGNNSIDFLGVGSTSGTFMKDITGASISFTAVKAPSPYQAYNGMVVIPMPSPKAATASLSVTPTVQFVNNNVTATVTQITPGFNGTSGCPITSVTAYFGDGTSQTAAPVSGVAKFIHSYSAIGTYTVSAKCYAAHMPSNLAYCWATPNVTVTILAKVVTGIDVVEVRHPLYPGDTYSFSGNGTGQPGRPYDPQALVELQAYVQYGGSPVQAKIVEFQINISSGPAKGQCILFRTNQTDANGYARIFFRIPEICWEYGGPTYYFGKWDIFVAVSMCEITYNDTMEFDVGWILNASTVSVGATVKKCEYVNFTVDVTNIDWVSVPVYIILVVYDNNEVPIGQAILYVSDVPGETQFCHPVTTTYSLSLHIPKYAYVGSSMGYINLFTGLPALGGLPFCPEASAGFVITS